MGNIIIAFCILFLIFAPLVCNSALDDRDQFKNCLSGKHEYYTKHSRVIENIWYEVQGCICKKLKVTQAACRTCGHYGPIDSNTPPECSKEQVGGGIELKQKEKE